MMSARIVIFFILLIEFLYEVITINIANSYRKKPLPKEVADIYDEERYQTYLNYSKEKNDIFLLEHIIKLLFDIFCIFSPFYQWIENLSHHNIYTIFIMNFLLTLMIGFLIDYLFQYIHTFKIEDKYGLNKQDIKKFNKNYFLEEIPLDVFAFIFMLGIIYVCEHMDEWTHHFQITFDQSLIIVGIIIVVIVIIVIVLSLITLWILKTKYTFTLLEDGELKDKINQMQETCQKKVKRINVYDESKNSTEKNAFLLKFLWIREFNIADNFINENSQKELFAVLSHEIGHLKHKKNIWNYLKIGFVVMIIVIVLYLINHVTLFFQINHWINQSFALTTLNYALLFTIYSHFMKIITSLIKLYNNNITRLEEYEADQEAVKNGYGEELIRTFKNISKDELMNVNPSPLIEFLEYDHPGMYRRIKAIQDGIKKM